MLSDTRPMTPHEIRPKQLRALLLLLVLVPLIPTALMLRFMNDALRGERAAALERSAADYRQALLLASGSFGKNVRARAEKITAGEAHDFFRGVLDRAVSVRIAAADGRALAGPAEPRGPPVARSSLAEFGLPWAVQLHLVDPAQLDEAVRDQRRLYTWIAAGSIFATVAIALAAGLAVSRQLALHELKTTAVAAVAHELRTPLASMRMLVDTLREGRCRDEAQRAEYLELIAGENARLSRVTENFLTLSRLERGAEPLRSAPLDPAAVLEEAVRPLRARLEAPGCRFTLEVAPALPSVAADRDALLTILTNLLDNALKYTGAEKEISLSVHREGDTVAFSVRDNGIGLSRDEGIAIFRPFFQAERKLSSTAAGCGLGLSIVQRLVTALAGKIAVQSEPGRGSTFTVSLPSADKKNAVR